MYPIFIAIYSCKLLAGQKIKIKNLNNTCMSPEIPQSEPGLFTNGTFEWLCAAVDQNMVPMKIKKKKKKYLITVKLLMVLEMLLRDIAFKRAQGGDFFSKCKEGGRV